MSLPANYSDVDVKKMDSSKDSSISSVKIESNESGDVLHDAEYERKLIRHIDMRILPLLALVYSFALIDRINLGAAHAAGMGKDLDLLVGTRFSVVTLSFFVPYVLLELPGGLLIKKYGARNMMSLMVLGFGSVQLGMGFVNHWTSLVVCRVLLGVFESAFFPAILWIISAWYKRHEVQKRIAAFTLIAVTAGGFSPVLAYAFSLLDGKRGIAGWKWIFIIEGAITILLAVVSYFFLPTFPNENRFLTPEQTAFVLKRINEDRGDAVPDAITVKKVIHHLKDWTIWAYGVFFITGSLPSYGQSFFMPIIFKGMGWSSTKALLLTTPPYIPTIFTTMLMAYFADKYKHRALFIAVPVLVCTAGLCLMAFASAPEVRYFGAFLINAGNSGASPAIVAYSSNNVVSHSKRMVQSSVLVSLGGVGGVIASLIFRAQDYPRYIPGLSATIAAQAFGLFVLACTTFHFARQNRLMREGKLKEPLEGTPGFYYTL